MMIAGLTMAISAPFARAQEDWGERREEYMHELREGCENGDDRACDRLRHMREERREREYERDRREDGRDLEGERNRIERPPADDPKVMLCLAIQNNYNNCVAQKQPGGCAAWVIELKANHCF
jgi:hypothetical protein